MFGFLDEKKTDILTVCGYFKMFSQKCRPGSSPGLGPAPSWEIPSCQPGVTFSLNIFPLLPQIYYNAVTVVVKAAFWPQRGTFRSGKWSSSLALHLLGILCYHFNKLAKVPWQLGVITTAKQAAPMEEILCRIKYSIFLLFFLLFRMCPFFCAAYNVDFSLFKRRKGLSIQRLLQFCLVDFMIAGIISGLKCIWTSVNVVSRRSFFLASRCQAEKGWGQRGCFISCCFLFVFNQVAPMLFLFRPLQSLHTSHRAVWFPISILCYFPPYRECQLMKITTI